MELKQILGFLVIIALKTTDGAPSLDLTPGTWKVSSAKNAEYAISAQNAIDAAVSSISLNAKYSRYSAVSNSSLTAEIAQYAVKASKATFAGTATYAKNATNATYAIYAEHAKHIIKKFDYPKTAGSDVGIYDPKPLSFLEVHFSKVKEMPYDRKFAERAIEGVNAAMAVNASMSINAFLADVGAMVQKSKHSFYAKYTAKADTARYALNASMASYANKAEYAFGAQYAEYAIFTGHDLDDLM